MEKIGTGYWQENDGARYLRRGPETVVEVTGNFDWKAYKQQFDATVGQI